MRRIALSDDHSSPALKRPGFSGHMNKNIDENFAMKALNAQTIAPGSTNSGLVFVPKEDWKTSYSIILTDSRAKEITLRS